MSVPMYLMPTAFIDSNHSTVIDYAQETAAGINADVDKAVALYYRIRDQFDYTPYVNYANPDVFKASWTLDQEKGFCTSKGALLAACARVLGIPSRLGFADVKNHITSERLEKFIGSDVMPWHAYTELFLKGKWVKATPAFNLALCEKFRIKPLDFTGHEDSIFHPFTEDGDKHMEYVRERGSFADVPYEQIMATFRSENKSILKADFLQGDFAREGAAEAKS